MSESVLRKWSLDVPGARLIWSEHRSFGTIASLPLVLFTPRAVTATRGLEAKGSWDEKDSGLGTAWLGGGADDGCDDGCRLRRRWW